MLMENGRCTARIRTELRRRSISICNRKVRTSRGGTSRDRTNPEEWRVRSTCNISWFGPRRGTCWFFVEEWMGQELMELCRPRHSTERSTTGEVRDHFRVCVRRDDVSIEAK